jgi:hypothetical protein
MTLPANIRVNTAVPFPALVQGSGPISIAKANGIWTIGVAYNLLGIQIPPTINFPTDYVLVYDSVAKTYFITSISSLISASSAPLQRVVTAAGDVTVASTDNIILLNKTVGATTNIILPTAVSRGGVAITVKDLKGDAFTNNITFVPNGTETIDGFSPAAAITNGIALIDAAYEQKTLTPLTSGGGWFL